MYEHQALMCDTPPSAQQLNEFSKEGWEFLQLLPPHRQG